MFDMSNCDVIYYVIYIICSHYVEKAISPLFAWPSSFCSFVYCMTAFLVYYYPILITYFTMNIWCRQLRFQYVVSPSFNVSRHSKMLFIHCDGCWQLLIESDRNVFLLNQQTSADFTTALKWFVLKGLMLFHVVRYCFVFQESNFFSFLQMPVLWSLFLDQYTKGILCLLI